VQKKTGSTLYHQKQTHSLDLPTVGINQHNQGEVARQRINMPLSELRLREVPPNELEYLATHPQCVRVGATGNVVSRANSYQNETVDGRPFAGYFYYSRARNARACEDRLLYIASRSGRGRFNVQQRSNFRYVNISFFQLTPHVISYHSCFLSCSSTGKGQDMYMLYMHGLECTGRVVSIQRDGDLLAPSCDCGYG